MDFFLPLLCGMVLGVIIGVILTAYWLIRCEVEMEDWEPSEREEAGQEVEKILSYPKFTTSIILRKLIERSAKKKNSD